MTLDRRRVVLVTGASSGIGRAAALQLARRGDAVVLLSRSAEALDQVALACRAEGTEVLVTPADVGDPGQVAEAVSAAVEQFGDIDGCIHAAAVMAYGRVEDVPAEVFAAVLRTNVLGAVHVAQALIPRFRAQGRGSLVIVGSVLGQITTPQLGAYVVSKWGLHGLARVLSQEVRDAPGVSVSLVAPGSVDTPIYQQAATYAGHLGAPPPPLDSPEKVASVAIKRLDRPRRRTGVGLLNPVMRWGFAVAPGLYDLLVGTLVERLALAKASAAATSGNVFEPRPEVESVSTGRRTIR